MGEWFQFLSSAALRRVGQAPERSKNLGSDIFSVSQENELVRWGESMNNGPLVNDDPELGRVAPELRHFPGHLA